METGTEAARRVFETADRVFYERGIRAVGVDALAAESGVGKMTLYRHFPSKDDLVVAYLEDRDRRFWEWFDSAAGRGEGDPAGQLWAVFDSLPELLSRAGYRGCPFLNAATEFPEPGHPARRVAVAHKRAVRERLRSLAEGAGAEDPGRLAGRLMLLMDGAFSSTQVFGAEGAAADVSATACGILSEWLPGFRDSR